jgi:hypothetical protein
LHRDVVVGIWNVGGLDRLARLLFGLLAALVGAGVSFGVLATNRAVGVVLVLIGPAQRCLRSTAGRRHVFAAVTPDAMGHPLGKRS